jgi:hypothetical protein
VGVSENRDREIIVTNSGGGTNFGTVIAGVIIAIALIFGAWYLVNNTSDDGDVLPDEVNVTIIDDTGGG